MSIAVIDYGSGNLRSAAKALEAAVSNANINEKIIVSSDPKVIRESKKKLFFQDNGLLEIAI